MARRIIHCYLDIQGGDARQCSGGQELRLYPEHGWQDGCQGASGPDPLRGGDLA